MGQSLFEGAAVVDLDLYNEDASYNRHAGADEHVELMSCGRALPVRDAAHAARHKSDVGAELAN